PYTLTVAGEAVDAPADGVNVTCGALPEGASTAPGTITAVVTDAGGTTATASAAYTIVPPLPAPARLFPSAARTAIGVQWERVLAAGPVPPLGSDCPCPLYLLRWRPAGTDTWTLKLHRDRTTSSRQSWPFRGFSDLPQGTTYELAVATLRDAIEQETPDALSWSATVMVTTVAPATGVRATATHDSIAVTWDAQLGARRYSVWLEGPRGSTPQFLTPDGRTSHEVVFRHLPPDTQYTVEVEVDAGVQTPVTEISVRTAPAAADWTPLPRGPQNLRTSVTHHSVTVAWNPPYTGARDVYVLSLFHGNKEVGSTGTSNGVTSHTFTGLNPHTPYMVKVTHSDIVREFAQATVVTAAQPGPPLRLSLTAGRAECTAGTLNPVTWKIEGGIAPYWLTVDGAVVNPDATSTRVTCGALPEGASAAQATTVAAVSDAAGARATASAAYTIVPPLPAPETPGRISAWPDGLAFHWYTAEPPPGADALVVFLMRWREVGSSAWTYDTQPIWRHEHRGITYGVRAHIGGLRDPAAYEVAVAPMRHRVEAETPQALRWTPTRQATTVTYPANVTATATHDTVTVRWDRQPSAFSWYVHVSNPDADVYTGRQLSDTDAATWGDPASAAHEVTFRHLLPDTEYQLGIRSQRGSESAPIRDAAATVRTKPAPAGSMPLLRGPQNVRATATATSITVTWGAPFAAARQHYEVLLLDQNATRVLYREWLYAPPWTFTFTSSTVNGGYPPWHVAPETTYSIRVRHNGVVDAEEELSIATQAAQPGADRSASADLLRDHPRLADLPQSRRHTRLTYSRPSANRLGSTDSRAARKAATRSSYGAPTASRQTGWPTMRSRNSSKGGRHSQSRSIGPERASVAAPSAPAGVKRAKNVCRRKTPARIRITSGASGASLPSAAARRRKLKIESCPARRPVRSAPTAARPSASASSSAA
ncbi:MAG: fibronectin type III domain-containing protein, partial [Gemmatimonadetes bacterium]|nr:fibronectin type III domain-containing protein [Gemmatimonadota bacterium]